MADEWMDERISSPTVYHSPAAGHIQTMAAARETCRRHHLEMRTFIELRLDSSKSLWKSD